jgi:hypothetical protein
VVRDSSDLPGPIFHKPVDMAALTEAIGKLLAA